MFDLSFESTKANTACSFGDGTNMLVEGDVNGLIASLKGSFKYVEQACDFSLIFNVNVIDLV